MMISLSEMKKHALYFHNLITVILKNIMNLDVEIHPGVKHEGDDVVRKWMINKDDTSLMTIYGPEFDIATTSSYRGLNTFIFMLWKILFTNYRYMRFSSEVIELIKGYSKYSLEELSLFLKIKGLNMDYFKE